MRQEVFLKKEANACVHSVPGQAMIQGELDVLKDWCYEAVRRPDALTLEHPEL